MYLEKYKKKYLVTKYENYIILYMHIAFHYFIL